MGYRSLLIRSMDMDDFFGRHMHLFIIVCVSCYSQAGNVRYKRKGAVVENYGILPDKNPGSNLYQKLTPQQIYGLRIFIESIL